MSEEEPEARALRESEQRFRALSEAAREAVFINENGIIRSRRGVDEGSFRFLAKPYSSEQLAQRVRQVLDD